MVIGMVIEMDMARAIEMIFAMVMVIDLEGVTALIFYSHNHAAGQALYSPDAKGSMQSELPHLHYTGR